MRLGVFSIILELFVFILGRRGYLGIVNFEFYEVWEFFVRYRN